MSIRLAAIIATLFSAAGIFVDPAAAADEPAGWCQSFDDASPSWEAADRDVACRVESHVRTSEGARTGRCELLQTTAAASGSYVLFAHGVGRARVMPELRPSVWIRSNRPGVQLLVRVVLPRVADPQTGQPLSTLLYGTTYSQVGRWQELHVAEVPLLLSRQVRVLRSKLGVQVDAREAYVDQILLNVYSGKGTSDIRVDDLTVRGYVSVPLDQADRLAAGSTGVSAASFDGQRAAPGHAAARERVQLHGSVLTADGHALFPRVIEYRGEPMTRLKSLGFNAVHLNAPATMSQLEEADRLGLWCVGPPPDVQPGTTISPAYRPVLCWDLGWGLSRDDLTAARHLATDLRRADHQTSRPVMCNARSDLRSYSRYADILLLDREPLGTGFELSDYGEWLKTQPRLARPGTPLWATIQTEPSENIVRQMTALGSGVRPTLGVQLEQVRALTYAAVASGARGLVFTSRNRLDSPEPVQEMRAEMLELINLELKLIEPWACGAEPLGTATASDKSVNVSVLATERARLLIAIHQAPGNQFVVSPGSGEEVSFVVPGVPESHTAYHLTTTGFQPLRHKRVTGGMRVTLPGFSRTGLIVLTQDPLVINDLARRVSANASRAAQLSHSLARRRMTLVENIQRIRAQAAFASEPAERWLPQARAGLRRCEQLLSRQDAEAAQASAQQVMSALRHVQRYHWENAPQGLASPVTNPLRSHFATLPLSWSFADRVQRAAPGPNLLPGGNFESLDELMRTGWQHLRHHDESLLTDVELSQLDKQSGRMSLRLQALPVQQDAPPQMIETPPLWIHSAPVTVRQGDILRIHGWTRVPTKIQGSQDGLMIFDSLAGQPLAARIDNTGQWSEFVFYRAADRDGPLVLTFALTGLGEAWVDDVTVKRLGQPVHQAQPPYGYGSPR